MEKTTTRMKAISWWTNLTEDEQINAHWLSSLREKQLIMIQRSDYLIERIFLELMVCFTKDGVLHRDGDQPAVHYPSGNRIHSEYYQDGLLHRLGDKPAVIWVNGSEEYFENGLRHRIGNPAVICTKDRSVQYWEKGVRKYLPEIRAKIKKAINKF